MQTVSNVSANPYQTPPAVNGQTIDPAQRVQTSCYPVPLVILGCSILIGFWMANQYTEDLRFNLRSDNTAFWLLTAVSMVFGSAGALFGYQYVRRQVPWWYSPVAIGIWAVIMPLTFQPNVDPIIWIQVWVAVCNAVVATVFPIGYRYARSSRP